MIKEDVDLGDCIEEAADTIRHDIQRMPHIGIILGSGLGSFAEKLENTKKYRMADFKGFPKPTVEGHTGMLIFGTYHGVLLAVLSGRFHYYEGYSQNVITIPVRLLADLGISNLILTNAAGSVNKGFRPGDVMLIRDHINMSGSNPLIGTNWGKYGPRFPDMGNVYTKEWCERLLSRLNADNIPVRQGLYIMFSGPSYETPAEIIFARKMGGDAVGMSTVPEAIVARHCGMNVLAFSCLTNMAAGVLEQKLCHDEVMAVAESAEKKLLKILNAAIETAV